jgi:hypothetical protein
MSPQTKMGVHFTALQGSGGWVSLGSALDAKRVLSRPFSFDSWGHPIHIHRLNITYSIDNNKFKHLWQ